MTAAVSGTTTQPSTSFATVAGLEGVPTGEFADGELGFVGGAAFSAGGPPAVPVTLTASFVQPAVANPAGIAATFSGGLLLTVGQIITIDGGNYQVAPLPIPAAGTANLINLGNPSAVAVGGNVPAGSGLASPDAYYKLKHGSTLTRNGTTVLFAAEANTAAPISAPVGTPGRWIVTNIA